MSVFEDKNNPEMIKKIEELENKLIGIARERGRGNRAATSKRREQMDAVIEEFLNELESQSED